MPALYDTIGKGYANYRRPDPRIAAALMTALGNARTVLNVGAGTGSYEPVDRAVIAVEPSEIMIRQRRGISAPVIRASAMDLPFRDNTFDAALAIFTVHHWPDQKRGLSELKRVAPRAIILTWEPPEAPSWLTRDYFPNILADGRNLLPPIASHYESVFNQIEVLTVPIPNNCSDGFLEAYWQRPESYFDPGKRGAISAFADVDTAPGLAHLRRDLDDGTWMRRNGHLLELDALDLGYRIVIGKSAP
jgi:SAM-dependent methyltransferase